MSNRSIRYTLFDFAIFLQTVINVSSHNVDDFYRHWPNWNVSGVCNLGLSNLSLGVNKSFILLPFQFGTSNDDIIKH